MIAAALLAALLLPQEPDTVTVGSKNFAESRLLGEMFAQLIEERAGLRVQRRLGLAGTQVCFEALRNGEIDLYPEYSGTALASILGESPAAGRRAAPNRVRTAFRERWDLWWLAPLGFENAYEIAVPRAVAEEHGLRTISDLARVAPRLRAGFGYEFRERDDGLPGLARAYGLEFAAVQGFQQALKYQAAGAGGIDCLDVYTTDGLLLVHDLLVLEDDRGFFPPYEAAAVVRGEILDRHPALARVLGLLAGALDEEFMRGLNHRVEHGGEAEAAVAADALRELGLVEASGEKAEAPRGAGLAAWMWSQRDALLAHTLRHLGLSAAGLLLAILLAVPLGMALERRRRLAEPVIRAVGLTQTLPSLALLAFMIPLLGIGIAPAVAALWIYAVFPILRNTYTGLRGADPAAVAAAGALGMTGKQVLRMVRLPLAAPVILAGVRTAAVITVGTATLAAFIGAGGLGVPILAGLQLADTNRILAGAIPAALLALLVDALLAAAERTLRPKGISSTA